MSYPGIASQSGYIHFSTNDVGLQNYAPLGGDVSGIISATLVEKIRNVPVASSGQFKIGQLFIFDGGQVLTSGIPTAQASPHNILSATHSDTSTAVPLSRGALLFGSGGPLWAALPLGLNGQVPQSNGTDLLHDYLGANTPFKDGTLGAPALSFQTDADTGWSRPGANRIAGSVSGIEMLRLDAPNGSVSLLAGQIIKTRIVSAAANIVNGDYVIVTSGNAFAVTLSTTPSGGQIHQVKDGFGLASNANPVTVSAGGLLIDGNPSVQIKNPYGSLTFMWNTVQWNIL
jgi:hypothetical protein